MSEYIPKYPSNEDDDSNKTSSELLAETLRPIYVPQDLMLAWESHLAGYSRDTHDLLDQVRDSEAALNTQYQALLTRVQTYEQMLQDITMDSNEFTMDTDEVNFTGWNILAQASYWDYLLRKEITKLSDQIKSAEYKGGLVTEVTDAVLGGLIANNTYISNVIAALSDTPLIRELDAALNSTTSSLTELQAEYVRLADKQVADAEALANQLVDNAEQLTTSLEAAIAEQLDRLAQEAAIRTQLLQELEDRADAMTIEYNAAVDALHTTVIQELNDMQDGITSSVVQLQTADEAIITSLDAYKVSNGQNIAALQSTVTTVSNTQESITTQVTGLIASFDQLDIGLSQAQADIITSNQARADGDEALSQQITTLNSGLGDANSRIDTVSTAVSTLDSATATKFSEVEATLVGVDDSIASVRQIANTAATTNTAQASEITALKSRMTVTEDDVITKADATALSTLETKVDNADSALSTRIDSLVANLTSSNGTEINANAFNTLRAEVTTNTGNITTHTSQITALNSSLSNVNTGISANADAVADLSTTVTQQGGSITSHSQAIQQLQSDLDVAEAGLSTKASTTALNTTNTNVSNIDGRVTANTNSVNSLGSRMDTVEGAVTTKLDASVISNYYTKGQADDKSAEIAAGKIESYDVNLVIGGANLYSGPNPIPMVGQTSEGAHNASSAYSEIIQLYKYLENPWFDWQDIAIGDDVVTSIEIMVPSGSIVGEHSIYIGAYRFGNNAYLQSAYKPLKEFPRDKWVKLSIPAGKFVDTGLTTPEGINISIYLSSCDVGTSFKWRNLMMEKGTKSSTFSESDKTLQFNINANANAIQTVNTEVSRINGEVVATANSVSTLNSNVGLLQGSINEVRQTVTNNQESTNILVTSLKSGMADADDVSMMMRNATVLHEDLSFKNGWNGVQVYNNHGNGALVANFTDKLPDNPVASTRQLQFIHSGGATTPALGGFHQAAQSRANGVFLAKFVAKLPVGFSFDLAANAYGDGANGYFIGSSEGTGKFKTYYTVYRCGATGSFSTVGFVYVNGQHPTPENPLIWYLASSTMYDCLDSKVAPDSVINGIAEARTTASTAVTKSDATAVMAQNLQTSLDNTNANISNNFYTKSSTDQAIASAATQLSSSFDTAISGVGVIKDTRNDNQPPSWYWANYPHRTEKEFKYSFVLGVPLATVNTLGVLETVVPWVDQSGGAIQQKFTWNDGAYALTRYSISSSEWSAWASAINEVKAIVNTKLDASIISNYYTKAEADNVVAGKIEQFGSKVLTSNENLFKGDLTTIPKSPGPGITTFNWDGAAIFDASAGHSGYIGLELGIGPYVINSNSQYAGPVTVSMDYYIGGDTSLVLPHFFFGQGYQACVATSSDPIVPNKWKRIYTTFYTNTTSLLSNPHLGLQGIIGRVFVKNLKVERGELTAYSADIKETTKSINGIEAIKTVTIDNNGVMSGYGLISQLKNGQVTSAFGVNADTFYIGGPALNKKPFLVTTYPQNIDGITYPPGTWINSAIIANATIGSAHIADAAITNAKIANIDAAKITAGIINADRIGAGSITVDKMNVNELSAITGNFGTFTTGTAGGARIEQRGTGITIYDASNKLRVKIGKLN